MTTIPKPDFPSARPRRSSIGQAAAANSGAADQAPPADIAPDQPTAARREAAAPVPEVVRAAEAGPAPEQQAPPAETPGSATPRGRTRRAPQKQAGQTTPSASTTASKRPVASKDILLSLPEDAKERMVNTITWTAPHTGIGQQQKFIRRAITELCERLERDFNDGQLFPTPAIPVDE
jgi:hypothetical protein